MTSVVFCVDKAGLRHFAVSATSLAVHRPANMNSGYLLSTDVTPADVEGLFDALNELYGFHFQLIRIPSELFEAFPVFGHVTVGTYFRLVIGEVLPDDISNVLYLDTDIVLHRPLDNPLAAALASLESSGHIAAAVREESETTKHLHKAGILEGPYLQAGVMLVNLPSWRDAFSLDYFVNLFAKYRDDIIWWDQDILNIALKDRWLELPRILNGTPGNRDAATAIYHYAGNQKPWRFKSAVEDREVYEQYRLLTPALRPPKTDPASVFRYYTKPFRTAKKVLKKKLRNKSKRKRR